MSVKCLHHCYLEIKVDHEHIYKKIQSRYSKRVKMHKHNNNYNGEKRAPH
jgi:hypothetical protein